MDYRKCSSKKNMVYLFALLFKVFAVTSMMFLIASAGQFDTFEKPKFKYVERSLVKITYTRKRGENTTLFICCEAQFEEDFDACDEMSSCPQFTMVTSCNIRGPQVCCEINMVLNNITIRGYVARNDGRAINISSDNIATYVTDNMKKVPKPVSNLSVTANCKQGLDLRWKPFSVYDYSPPSAGYNICIDCQPENNRAKAFRETEFLGSSHLMIKSKDITAASKYTCCVHVVNVVTSGKSELSCKNVTTPEQVPGAPPVITCGNKTVCPSLVHGRKRNITILFKLPDEERNGKVIRYEVFYKNSTAVNVTELVINNGSASEAVIENAESEADYVAYMTFCNKIGCSPISNTVRVAAVSFHGNAQRGVVVVVITVVTSLCLLALIVIALWVRRYQRREREAKLPKLVLPMNDGYEYPGDINRNDDFYHELKDAVSEENIRDAIVVRNPVSVTCEI